jgi:hypothetical protein
MILAASPWLGGSSSSYPHALHNKHKESGAKGCSVIATAWRTPLCRFSGSGCRGRTALAQAQILVKRVTRLVTHEARLAQRRFDRLQLSVI